LQDKMLIYVDNCYRDTSVKISYTLVSDTNFSNRHSIRIYWSKAQENPPTSSPFPDIDCVSSPKSVNITMISVSTPNTSQSESYVATVALFLIFSSSVREEKVYLRLPPAWRELWLEFATVKKEQVDSADREAIRGFRDIIREKRDREEEDGVILTTAFKRRGALLTPNDTSDESGPEKTGRSAITPEALQKIWADKSQTPAFQMMLVSLLTINQTVLTRQTAIKDAAADVGFQG
jgi:ATP-dependent RNA helicase DHX29